jgi:hypothetical protein
MYILSKHRELSKQMNIHEITENVLAETLHHIKIMQPTEDTKKNRRVLFEQGARTCLGYVTNTNGFSKRFKPTFIKRFGEYISQLIFCGNKHNSYFLRLDKVTDEMMPDVNVLGPRMLNWTFGNVYSTGIVTVNDHSILSEARITE